MENLPGVNPFSKKNAHIRRISNCVVATLQSKADVLNTRGIATGNTTTATPNVAIVSDTSVLRCLNNVLQCFGNHATISDITNCQ